MDFKQQVEARIKANENDKALRSSRDAFVKASMAVQYSYNFTWLGRPIIQYPQDMVAMQEILWEVQPDLIVETGIAHGGSLIFSASMLELIASCGGPEGEVLGIDIDIREHNRRAIEQHPLFKRIDMIEGSSTSTSVIEQVHDRARGKNRVLVCLDSDHTQDHVLAELDAYASLTTVGSYCVVFDTVIEELPEDMFPDRPWSTGNNPETAVREFLGKHDEFEVDRRLDNKLQISVARGGYLKRVR